MATHEESYTCSPSTKWEWKLVKMSPPPGGDRAAADIHGRRAPLSSRDPHKPISIEVRYKGGAEASYVVTYRGRVWRFPGYVALHDMMQQVNGQRRPVR